MSCTDASTLSGESNTISRRAYQVDFVVCPVVDITVDYIYHSFNLFLVDMNKNKNKKFIFDPNRNSYIIQIHQINQ